MSTAFFIMPVMLAIAPPVTGAAVDPPAIAVPAAPPVADDQGTDIVVTATPRNAPGDPLATVNAQSFAVTEKVDDAVFGPVALAYGHAMPKPLRNGLRNFLSNLHEPVVFINYLAQLKPGKAIETVGRFAINSTVGAAGLFDIAKRHPFNLRYRANGFANTLGYYGVKPGPFLYLPLIGPTTVRDLFGNGLDGFVIPIIGDNPFASPAFAAPAGTLRTLDHRAEIDERLKDIRDAGNHYAASRRRYLEGRQAEIDALHVRKRRLSPEPPDPPDPAFAPSPTSTR